MIYAALTVANEPTTLYTFANWEEYRNLTFSPEITVEAAASTEITRKNYRSEKMQAIGRLQDLQDVAGVPGMSYNELFIIQTAAERIARRYGLLAEARENGVC